MADRFPPLPDRRRCARLRSRLLGWYGEHARDLPWRRTRDPYAVWVSEAMLQQTRVETVLEYFPRFLARFPTLEALADAPEEAVLAAWSGLGYYRRARALRAASRAIVEHHGGRFPTERAAALALPGVGPYTAGAVLSIAYDLPEAAVDGNVERVLSRLFGLDAAAGSPGLGRACRALAERLVPGEKVPGTVSPGTWNQALMELGATVCTPRPRCGACPIARSCRARREGRAQALPRPRARPAAVEVELELAVVERPAEQAKAGRAGIGRELLLEPAGHGGRMAGLWQFPTVERPDPAGRRSGLFPAHWPEAAGLEPGERLFPIRHGITHHRIRGSVRSARVGRGAPPAGWRWVPAQEVGALPLTGMAKKVLRGLQGWARVAEGPPERL